MSEKQIVLELAARTQLLGVGDTEQERRANAARFSGIAAWLLREFGWGRISHEGESAVDGKSADKLLNKNSLEVVDIIVDAEGTAARAAWQIQAERLPIDRWIAPVAPDGEDPREQPREQPRDDDDDFDAEAFATAAVEDVVEALQAIAINLDRIADVLERLPVVEPAKNHGRRDEIISAAGSILGSILNRRGK